jgi:hypothetical protein
MADAGVVDQHRQRAFGADGSHSVDTVVGGEIGDDDLHVDLRRK